MLVAACLAMCAIEDVHRAVTRWRWPGSGCGYLAGYPVCDRAGHAIACRVGWHGIPYSTGGVDGG